MNLYNLNNSHYFIKKKKKYTKNVKYLLDVSIIICGFLLKICIVFFNKFLKLVLIHRDLII